MEKAADKVNSVIYEPALPTCSVVDLLAAKKLIETEIDRRIAEVDQLRPSKRKPRSDKGATRATKPA